MNTARLRVGPIFALICCIALWLYKAPNATAEETPVPQHLVQQFHAAIIDIMQQGASLSFEQRVDRLNPVFAETFDMRVFAYRTVGALIWKELSDDQKNTFVETYTRFLVASYADKFDSYSGQIFEFLSTKDALKGTVYVKTQIVRSGKEPVMLDYLVGARDGKHGIIDVFFDNASETSRRLSEFKSIYYNSGYDALISSLEAKTGQMASKVGPSSPNGVSETN